MSFPVDGKWITQTETKLDLRFPASFVTEISKMNGGSVQTCIDQFELFPFLDASDHAQGETQVFSELVGALSSWLVQRSSIVELVSAHPFCAASSEI